MNPIARLEELRAARKRVLTLPPADSPDSPDSLTRKRVVLATPLSDSPDSQGNRAAGRVSDTRESRDNRAGQDPKSTEQTREVPTARHLGQSGESGGGESESDVMALQRWGKCPREEVAPFTYYMPSLHSRDVDLLRAHLKRQPPDAWQWVERQAQRYAAAARHWPRPVCELAAMLDCLLWQWEFVLDRNAGRFDRITEAAQKLQDLEVAAQDAALFFATHPLPPTAEAKKGEGE